MTRMVGKGSTPEHTRFQKGKSGNPRGRPKGKVSFKADLISELSETIQITEGGKSKRITKQRALLKALTTGGIKGDVRAAHLMMKWAAAVIDAPESASPLPPLTVEDRRILQNFLTRHPLSKENEND